MQNYKNLTVFQDAYKLSLEMYKATDSFPKKEMYSLTNQIRRAATSVAANISEGAARYSDKDFAHFIQISIGSICELECLIILSYDLEYLPKDKLIGLTEQIRITRMKLIALNKTLRQK